MRHFITISLSTLLLVSCAYKSSSQYAQTVQSWRGGSAKTLVKTWGRPDSVAKTAGGETVYFYNTRSYAHTPTQMSAGVGMHINQDGRPTLNRPTANTTSPWSRGSITQVCTAAFIADQHGKITDIQTKGSSCYGSDTFAKRLSNPKQG